VKGWRAITERDLAPYLARYADDSLVSRVKALYDQQKHVWPEFRRGHEAMLRAERRVIELDNCRVICQHTPHRMQSVSARVDPVSIQKRSCFLCPASLHPEERGITYGNEYLILCNISPIFDHHVVISHQHHRPQAIRTSFADAMTLARELSPHFSLIYNGPRCGASAPDHLHFQAFPEQNLPLQNQVWRDDHVNVRATVRHGDDILITASKNSSRRFLTFKSRNRTALCLWFFEALAALKSEQDDGNDEPMINLVIACRGNQWELILFPRAKHRPDCFHDRGDGQFLISPGAIDMAGVVVVPRKTDYERMTAEILKDIYQEVTIREERFSRLLDALMRQSKPIG
jgi:hypothetical protein